MHSRSGGSPVVLVVQSVYLVVDVAVLQVEVGAEAAYQFIIDFQINISVVLYGVVAVVVVVGVQFADIVLYPKHFSEVVAVIAVQCIVKSVPFVSATNPTTTRRYRQKTRNYKHHQFIPFDFKFNFQIIVDFFGV